jgi:hypothetical protein
MRSFAYRVTKLASLLAAVRIGVLWFLIYREATHQQRLVELPLVLLLYPEGLLLPRNFAWTVGTGVAFSGALMMGSFLLVAFVIRAAPLLRLRQ